MALVSTSVVLTFAHKLRLVNRVVAVANVRMSVAHTPTSDRDVLDAVEVLQAQKKLDASDLEKYLCKMCVRHELGGTIQIGKVRGRPGKTACFNLGQEVRGAKITSEGFF